ncbi:putative inner membrane protein [Roseovarius gaetbuli]|uniref:Putative inner membrane protein n=1 Tax=Roseovarius gaetbuli TaxID=1356575 RepID=A0A1X6YIF2_9RHOB|nr:YeeE/YedE family protein [Roseovarius gaetbuli]SLN21530.1 putative inner membrane protein [Roseovarius gaetbuli]
MLHGIPEPLLIALIGFGGGALLGLAARLGRFCTLGAIEDYLYQQSDTRLRMWVLAIGVAGMLTFGLAGLGLVNLAGNIYYITPWSPLITVLGGLMFGYGMSLAGNCGFGALARFGGGDLRSFVIVIVMGIAAYVMMSGPLARLRLAATEATTPKLETDSYAQFLSQATGLSVVTAGLALSLLIALAALGSRRFLQDRKAVFWSLIVGVAVASGWAGSTWLATHGFSPQPIQSHTFSAPLGETILFLMTASGGGLSFGVGSVFGVLAGAFCGSLIKGHFRWEACEDPRELRRQILGAVCMGFGAVLAFGCTIGQGVSAFSVLALSAPITFVAIFIGAAIGLRQLITGFA